MMKSRVVGVILAIIALIWMAYFIIGTYFYTLGIDIERYDAWEISLFSQAVGGLMASITSGMLALAFYKEQKSPYLLEMSTIIASLAIVLLLIRNSMKGYLSQPFSFNIYLFFLTPLMLLLFSTILIAYANIWKENP